ncbi:hypothetical protein KAX97_02890 [candidate division WOR-3 bacterium]|nr:hypothetical protein [candidate division WOR-3 bacterium]
MLVDDLSKLIEKKLHWSKVARFPRFLNKYKWRPRFVFSDVKTKTYIAVDVVFSQQFPKRIYETEIKKAVGDNTKLRICFFSSSEYGYYTLKKFCMNHNFGLKVYTKNSINTILPFPSEEVESVSSVQMKREGWFPQVILDKAKDIKRISFKEEIVDLVNRLEKSNRKETQLSNICKSIDKMLASRPKYFGSSIPFMRLSCFENLLNSSEISCRDHTFHSARVFLIGCIIIDAFYDRFVDYYKRILGTHKFSIEYMWLIASLFHDLGRIKQGVHRIYLSDPKKENAELNAVIEELMRKRWKEDEYITALGNIVELIKQSCRSAKKRDIPFTGYALHAPIDANIAHIFQENYNTRKSHGVIGCFDLSADLLRKVNAAKNVSKTFMLYHIFPATVAIALHDWRIWGDLHKLKVFPVALRDFPMAALLIYIDTWDDFKRQGQKERITINDLSIHNSTVTVDLTWHKSDEYLEEKLKYDSFERNVSFSDLKLEIVVSNRVS